MKDLLQKSHIHKQQEDALRRMSPIPTIPDAEREHIKDNVLKAILEWNTLERQAHERERREGGKDD